MQQVMHLTLRVCHGMCSHAGNHLYESWEWGCLCHRGGFPNRTVSIFREPRFSLKILIYYHYYYYLEEMVLWEKLFSSKWYLWGLWSKESGSLSVSMCDVSLWFQEEEIGLEHSGMLCWLCILLTEESGNEVVCFLLNFSEGERQVLAAYLRYYTVKVW